LESKLLPSEEDAVMSYDAQKEVQFEDQERLVQLLMEIASRLEEVRSILNPTTDSWPLAHGEVGVILLPSDPPDTACILEHPDTGHWMLQHPCGGIFVADLTGG
jgi:type IV secretory pathway ATPase VirB11/archaellum biosynthesis ATPase